MRALIVAILTLISYNTQAMELEISNNITFHLIKSIDSVKMYNDIGDGRTTINPVFRLKTDSGLSFMYLRDSIGDYNLGASYGLQRPLNSKVKWGLEGGFYFINSQRWLDRKFTQFWIPAGDKGLAIIAGPTLEVELFKHENLKLKSNSFFCVGGFIMTGLALGVEF